VLIVEDEPALLEQLGRALADADYVVDSAADGERADFAVRTESYDAVPLDLGCRASMA
jgi:two-component system OmpR family response regulator